MGETLYIQVSFQDTGARVILPLNTFRIEGSVYYEEAGNSAPVHDRPFLSKEKGYFLFHKLKTTCIVN
jgi:hypothetical protein